MAAIADPRVLVVDSGHQQGGEGARCYKAVTLSAAAWPTIPARRAACRGYNSDASGPRPSDEPRPAADDRALPLPRSGACSSPRRASRKGACGWAGVGHPRYVVRRRPFRAARLNLLPCLLAPSFQQPPAGGHQSPGARSVVLPPRRGNRSQAAHGPLLGGPEILG